MSAHPNAPLTPEGRQRLCERIDAGRPLAHVSTVDRAGHVVAVSIAPVGGRIERQFDGHAAARPRLDQRGERCRACHMTMQAYAGGTVVEASGATARPWTLSVGCACRHEAERAETRLAATHLSNASRWDQRWEVLDGFIRATMDELRECQVRQQPGRAA
jgi:hypothetical protein